MISIYVISFYKFRHTMKCLASIKGHIRSRYEVILVENCSATPEQWRKYQELQAQWPALKIIRLDRQHPCPWIRARVLDHATGEYIFFMDNDCFVENDPFPTLVSELENDQQTAGISPALLYFPSRRLQCLGIRIKFFEDNLFEPSHLCHDEPYEWHRERRPFYSDFIPGGCSLFRRNFLEQCTYDPRLKNVFGDFDLCLQGRERGWRYKFHPGCYLMHDKTAHSTRYLKAKGQLTDWPGSVQLFEEKWGLRYFILKHIEMGRVVLDQGNFPRWLPREEWPGNREQQEKGAPRGD